ncbi:energy-coupling factor transporter transmembrane protein EcfT [Paenibacillus sp. ACRRX]|uniref:energy-coupling factor transporter transmembrane component T family protein n=1 Tax=Paenibacillus sp. ACRRX TaxID=2918206 RepID=UPI001EF42C2A|nr:energy-coupling factor transporter transmembrane component T [Paenibacillus sp. ACRRX]MCG7408566.1 energy-coupling factor transporter transmembrane protein EcfT [Paenibacillus sp. ACRRX]
MVNIGKSGTVRLRAWLHRLDPITKGIWLLSTGLAVMMTMSLAGQAAWFASVLLFAWTGGDWSGRQWRLLFIWLLGFGIPLIVFQWLVLPGETPILSSLTGKLLTEEALRDSVSLTLRSMTLMASSIVYATTTEPRDVVVALVGQLRVPDRVAYAAAIALRFVPLLLAEAEQMRHAQRLRRMAPARGVGERLRSARQLLLAVTQAALRHVHIVSTSMEAKRFGQGGQRTLRRKLRIRPQGIGLAAVSIGTAVTSLYWL